jgi:hypothetical protein
MTLAGIARNLIWEKIAGVNFGHLNTEDYG